MRNLVYLKGLELTWDIRQLIVLPARSMTPYNSKSGKKSGVKAFKIGKDYIMVLFDHSNKVYIYNYSVTGRSMVEEMKSHALTQKGLSTYISKNNPPYIISLK